MSTLYPLGTVVQLHIKDAVVMIAGYCPINKEKHQFYKYLGISYPLGLHANSNTIMFDDKAIQRVLFTGFENEKSCDFCAKLKELIDKIDSNKQESN